MKKKPTLDEIIKKNPSIKKSDVERGMGLAKELRELGVNPKGYQLASPSSRRQPMLDPSDTCDPRTINLSGRRR